MIESEAKKIAMKLFKLFLTFIFISSLHMVSAQNIQAPRASQAGQSSQKIGLAQIDINYSRPGVKGREIFGNIVPFDQVWRAGANENTTITFSKPVMISGKEVPAGTYGLHIIPTDGDDWTFILNKQSNSWGSYFYDEAQDMVRVTGKSKKISDNQEWLDYDFDNLSDRSCDVVMSWSDRQASFPITVDTEGQMLSYITNEYLTGLSGFGWNGYNNAASYCAQNDVALEKANEWVDISIKRNKNFSNLSTKYLLLKKSQKDAEAKKLLAEALPMGGENEINTFGYVMLGQKDVDVAIQVFKHNVKENPKSWNVWDSLAEAYAIKGEKDSAIKNYKKALSLTTDENQKKRIEKTLADLSAA